MLDAEGRPVELAPWQRRLLDDLRPTTPEQAIAVASQRSPRAPHLPTPAVPGPRRAELLKGHRAELAILDEAVGAFVDVPGIDGVTPTYDDDATDALWNATLWAASQTPEVYRTILGMRPCPRCQGACITVEDAAAARASGWRTRVDPCPFCGGRGLVAP